MRSFTVTQLVRGGLIAAVYAILALLLPEFSYGPVQFRLSESLVLLPTFLPEAIPGLIIGCFIANLGSPFGILDIVCGTLCTALAAWLTWRLRQRSILAIAAPILINAFGVSAYVAWLSQEMYLAIVPMIGISEAVVVICLALPFTSMLRRLLKPAAEGIPLA